MLGGSWAELFAQLAQDPESFSSVILGLAFIGFGAAMIVNARRRPPPEA